MIVILVVVFAFFIGILSAVGEEDDSQDSSTEETRDRSETEEEEPEPVAVPSRSLEACKDCGAVVLMPGSRFCWNCGTSLRVGDAAATPPMRGKGRPLKRKCIVCGLQLNSRDEIVHCPHCGNAAHRDHMLEWLHVNRTCPMCHNHLDEHELKAQLDKRPHSRAESKSSG